MSLSVNDISTVPLSKVTILPVKDTTRGTDALKVTIKKMSSEAKDGSASSIPDAEKQSKSVVPSTPAAKDSLNNSEQNETKSTMTCKPIGVACASQDSEGTQNPSGHGVANKAEVSTPCVKHAALNISRKASDIPSEKINLCHTCSKSMLSYIFLVQDFLDSLAQEICGDSSAKQCLQCAREELRDKLSTRDEDNAAVSDSKKGDSKGHHEISGDAHHVPEHSKREGGRHEGKRPHRGRSHRGHRKHDENRGPPRPVTEQEYASQQCKQIDFLYNVSSASSPKMPHDQRHHDERSDAGAQENQDHHHKHHQGGDNRHHGGGDNDHHHGGDDRHHHGRGDRHHHHGGDADHHRRGDDRHHHGSDGRDHHHGGRHHDRDGRHHHDGGHHHGVEEHHHGGGGRHHHHHGGDDQPHHSGKDQGIEQPPEGRPGDQHTHVQPSGDASAFIAPMERQQPSIDNTPTGDGSQGGDKDSFTSSERVFFGSDADGIVTTLSNVEREVYDAARNGAGWESLSELQERLGTSSGGQITSEAFVTSCRNNAEAVGCLVVGTSLLLTRTSRTLCVLVSDGVSTALRGPLSAVFQVVQYVRSLDSLGTTKLSLLEQPELGITFDKLNVWRLAQFNKCVYLNPDTLVIQNCDELFCHEELSAVPDIGWPDCFNSGVFVFVPSVHTFWQLLEFADKQGSYDGGDQGLLNSYFSSWSHDINRKLSFIYNLMANVSYTYTPAFRQFGRNVKIVQFHGSFKPWHVKFFTNTGQISPSSPVHPTYVQFVHIWLNIFRISVLRLMSQEIQSYSAAQSVICAVEILRFFPLPSESEAEFYLTPPSVRLRLAEKRLHGSTSLPISEVQRRKSAEFPRPSRAEAESIDEAPTEASKEILEAAKADGKSEPATGASASAAAVKEETSSKQDEASAKEGETSIKDDDTSTKEEIDEYSMPGAEIGDYQGMKKWEQGRMDYQGTDSSENIIKRLQYLMSQPK